MRPARDRHILEWTMGTIGISSLLLGAAMQTEALRAFCGSVDPSQAGMSEDCVQNRIAEAQARAQGAEAGRAVAERPAPSEDSNPKSTLGTSDPAPNRLPEKSAPPRPEEARRLEPSQSRP